MKTNWLKRAWYINTLINPFQSSVTFHIEHHIEHLRNHNITEIKSFQNTLGPWERYRIYSSMKNQLPRERSQKTTAFPARIFRKTFWEIHYLINDVNLLILLLEFLSKCLFLKKFHLLLGCPTAKLRPLSRG